MTIQNQKLRLYSFALSYNLMEYRMNTRLFILMLCFPSLFSFLNSQEINRPFPFVKTQDFSESFIQEGYLQSWGWPWSTDESKEEKEEKEEKDLNPFRAEKLIGLKSKLQERIVGQDQAIQATVSALELYANGLNDPYAPIASLLYMGPTGVGKTQLARELAKVLLGDEKHLIRLNMSEYVSGDSGNIYRLIGTPPGYVNHEEGGQFTEALKKQPYAIVLLDEVEKASPYVLKIFLQLFDEGFITDSKGTLIDCRNCLFILTTNLEGQKILTMHDLGHSNQEILAATQPTLMNELSPEFYNRLEPVIFRGLKENVLDELTNKLLLQAAEELTTKRKITIDFDQSVIQFLKMQGTNYLLGARPFKTIIKQTVVGAITQAMQQKYLKPLDRAIITYEDNHHDFIIQNLEGGEPFIWHWNEMKPGLQPPFALQDLLNLESKLKQKILGQPYAIKMTVAALMRYAAGLSNDHSPIGAFLYVGPTGVGKTQLAKELAIELMGGEQHLIRLDMSEYSEPHSISRLIGSPPGYVNHQEGGQLTEALKQHPYAIVLLDEIEKAHPVVLKTFLQVFDEGRLSDTQGTVIDCRNVIFIATTNLASAQILYMHQEGFKEKEILAAIQPDVAKYLSPELYNRLEVAAFMGLSSESLDQLVRNLLKEIQLEIRAKKMIELQFDLSLIEFLKVHGYDYELGARPLKRLIQQTVMTTIAREIIAGHVQVGDKIKLSYYKKKIVIEKENQ